MAKETAIPEDLDKKLGGWGELEGEHNLLERGRIAQIDGDQVGFNLKPAAKTKSAIGGCRGEERGKTEWGRGVSPGACDNASPANKQSVTGREGTLQNGTLIGKELRAGEWSLRLWTVDQDKNQRVVVRENCCRICNHEVEATRKLKEPVRIGNEDLGGKNRTSSDKQIPFTRGWNLHGSI